MKRKIDVALDTVAAVAVVAFSFFSIYPAFNNHFGLDSFDSLDTFVLKTVFAAFVTVSSLILLEKLLDR